MGVRQHEGGMCVRGKNVDYIRNYFPVPNEIFRLGLSGGEILVYCYLMYCEDRTTYPERSGRRQIQREHKERK